jgi:signal transduction histidine kinase
VTTSPRGRRSGARFPRRAEEVIRRNHELFQNHTVRKTRIDLNEIVCSGGRYPGRGWPSVQPRRFQQSPGGSARHRRGPRRVAAGVAQSVANSIDAMADTDSEARVLKVATVLTPAAMVMASVSDTGVGLHGVDPGANLQLCIHNQAKGTGVGLSISRSIVDAHGGKLWAEQHQGPEATFSFTGPVHSAAISTGSAPRRSGHPM